MEISHINYIVGRAHLIGKKQWDSYELIHSFTENIKIDEKKV